jgi:hypothetical protein
MKRNEKERNLYPCIGGDISIGDELMRQYKVRELRCVQSAAQTYQS